MTPPSVLVICGAAGMGKSSVAYEVADRLARTDIAHALIDSDELDRVHPWPPAGLGPGELSRRNLAAVWTNYARLGHSKLLITGVFVRIGADLRWIADAVPGAVFTVVRLTADPSTLEQRIRRREIGSGAEEQLHRSRQQLDRINRGDPPGTHLIDTSEQSITDTAARIISHWIE